MSSKKPDKTERPSHLENLLTCTNVKVQPQTQRNSMRKLKSCLSKHPDALSQYQLKTEYSSKLNRDSILKAKDKIVKEQITQDILNRGETIEQITQKRRKISKKAVEGVEKFLRRGKDALQRSQKFLKGQTRPIQRTMTEYTPMQQPFPKDEPIPEENSAFEQYVERIFKKIQAKAIRHRLNFKNTNYDLDTKVSCFISGRDMYLQKLVARQNEQELHITVVPPSDSEDNIPPEKTGSQKLAITKHRLKELFRRHPVCKTRYDEECLDMCIPNSPVLTQKRYEEIVSDNNKVDQIALIMIRFNKLSQDMLDKLCFVIPRIDAWDFAKLRDNKVELRHLKMKVIGMPRESLLNMSDIEQRVADFERQVLKKKDKTNNQSGELPSSSKYESILASRKKSHNKVQSISLMPFGSESHTLGTNYPKSSSVDNVGFLQLQSVPFKEPKIDSGLLPGQYSLPRTTRNKSLRLSFDGSSRASVNSIEREQSRQKQLAEIQRQNTAKDLFLQQMEEVHLIEDHHARIDKMKKEKEQKMSLKRMQLRLESPVKRPENKASVGGDIQHKLIQQVKERERKLRAREEALKQQKLKLKGKAEFIKRLSNSREHNLVSERVQRSLDESLKSINSSRNTPPQSVDKLERQYSKNYKPQLKKKPRPRDIYQPNPIKREIFSKTTSRHQLKPYSLHKRRAMIPLSGITPARGKQNSSMHKSSQQITIEVDVGNSANRGSSARPRPTTTTACAPVSSLIESGHFQHSSTLLLGKVQSGISEELMAGSGLKEESNIPKGQSRVMIQSRVTPNLKFHQDADHTPKHTRQKRVTRSCEKEFSEENCSPDKASGNKRKFYDNDDIAKSPHFSNHLSCRQTSSGKRHHRNFISDQNVAPQPNPLFSADPHETESSGKNKFLSNYQSQSNRAFSNCLRGAPFAMRPQSGVPLSSHKVVPKNLDNKMLSTLLNIPEELQRTRQTASNMGITQNRSTEVLKQSSSALNACDNQSTMTSQQATTAGLVRYSSGVISQKGYRKSDTMIHTMRGSLMPPVRSSTAEDISNYEGATMTDKKTNFDSLRMSHTDISDKFISFCEYMGIPITKTGKEINSVHKTRRRQQLLFSVDNPENYLNKENRLNQNEDEASLSQRGPGSALDSIKYIEQEAQVNSTSLKNNEDKRMTTATQSFGNQKQTSGAFYPDQKNQDWTTLMTNQDYQKQKEQREAYIDYDMMVMNQPLSKQSSESPDDTVTQSQVSPNRPSSGLPNQAKLPQHFEGIDALESVLALAQQATSPTKEWTQQQDRKSSRLSRAGSKKNSNFRKSLTKTNFSKKKKSALRSNELRTQANTRLSQAHSNAFRLSILNDGDGSISSTLKNTGTQTPMSKKQSDTTRATGFVPQQSHSTRTSGPASKTASSIRKKNQGSSAPKNSEKLLKVSMAGQARISHNKNFTVSSPGLSTTPAAQADYYYKTESLRQQTNVTQPKRKNNDLPSLVPTSKESAPSQDGPSYNYTTVVHTNSN